jgi:hypothetical protein
LKHDFSLRSLDLTTQQRTRYCWMNVDDSHVMALCFRRGGKLLCGNSIAMRLLIRRLQGKWVLLGYIRRALLTAASLRCLSNYGYGTEAWDGNQWEFSTSKFYKIIPPIKPLWPPLWSSGQSSWLHKRDVLCFLWGTNWIYICYVEESRPPLWSSGQSSLLQILRLGFNSRHYQKKSSGSGTGSTQPREYNWGATCVSWLKMEAEI